MHLMPMYNIKKVAENGVTVSIFLERHDELQSFYQIVGQKLTCIFHSLIIANLVYGGLEVPQHVTVKLPVTTKNHMKKQTI